MRHSYILGINLSHDRSTCLLEDGKPVVAIAEERLDRVKHSIGRITHDDGKRLGPKTLPWKGMTYCLDQYGLGLDDLDLIMVDQAGARVMPEWLAEEIPIRDKSKIRSLPHPSHHLAHAYSAYYASPFGESAILVADNIGSYVDLREINEGETGYHAVGTEMTEVLKTWSEARDLESNSLCLGRIYRMASLALGFSAERVARGQLGYTIQILDDAGKTMGLAPYGRLRKDWPPFVVLEGDEPSYPNFIPWLEKQGLLKRKKQDGVTILELQFLDPKKSLSKFHRDLAFKVQDEVEKGLVFLANRLHEKTGSENLCIGGGVGLNSVANYRVLKESPFKRIFIQPAATDDGTALGAAYYGYVHCLGGEHRHPLRTASLGRCYSRDEIYKALFNAGIYHFDYLEKDALVPKVAEWISKGQMIGWFQGGSEFGPRALGNRSILADPRVKNMKDILNSRVKFRESFRPYAPSVLLEDAKDYFELDGESPFMLLVPPVRKDKRCLVPAITHVDGTARVQTVTREDNGIYYDLIEAFKKITGLPMLLNTSFNIRGMPIVEKPEDAIRCFLKTDLDALVMETIVVTKEIYPDQELMALTPVVIVKMVHEAGKKRGKAYWTDLWRQEIISISCEEEKFLNQCDGKQRVGEIAKQNRMGKHAADFVRKLFRKGLISFRNPYQPEG